MQNELEEGRPKLGAKTIFQYWFLTLAVPLEALFEGRSDVPNSGSGGSIQVRKLVLLEESRPEIITMYLVE
jgi:hypothetical protein